MSYTFVKVDRYYHEYLEYYYARYPQVKSWPYEGQLSHLYDDVFALSNFFSKNLRALGVDAHEIVENALPLQDAWKKQNGVRANGYELLIAQLNKFNPDVVLMNAGRTPFEVVNTIREKVKSIRCLIGNCSSPYSDKDMKEFASYDFVITCSAGAEIDLRNQGIKVYHINHAFEHTLLPKVMDDNIHKESDVLISGSIGFGENYHNIRRRTIVSILEQGLDVSLRASIKEISRLRHFARCGAYAAASSMKKLGLFELAKALPILNKATSWNAMPQRESYPYIIKRKALPPLFGIEMLKAMHKTRVAFNSHIDMAGNYAANMRLFEATGVGTCLVTDWKKNLHELFAPETEVISYRTAEECAEKIKWLIENPAERVRIAKAGQDRTLKEHTWNKRIPELDHIIRRNI